MTQYKFCFNNEYLQKYFDHIESCKMKETDGELHHIYPKCVFGENDHLILLSVLDHFKAHWYLYKAYNHQWKLDKTLINSKHYRGICFGLSSFNQINDTRRKRLSLLGESDLEEYGFLIAEARKSNNNAMVGDLNPSKRADVREKISKANTGKPHPMTEKGKKSKKEKILAWHKTEEGINFYKKLSAERKGVPLSEEHKEKIRKTTQTEEFRKNASNLSLERNADEDWYNSVYTDEYRKMISDRFAGVPKSEEQKKKISESHTGTVKPWVADKINRNPEKIRKTAEKHRGMKRTEQTRKNISDKRKEYYQTHEIHNKGKTAYYDPNNPENHIMCLIGEQPIGWVKGDWKFAEVEIGFAITIVFDKRIKKEKVVKYKIMKKVYKNICLLRNMTGTKHYDILATDKKTFLENIKNAGYSIILF